MQVRSTRQEVSTFLSEMKNILNSPDFNIDADFLLNVRPKPEEEKEYSTPQTLVDLEYDATDVVARLRELEIQDYSETLLDKDNTHPPFLFVLGKRIEERLIYIKVKIKNTPSKRVLCVSFHKAKHDMDFPFS